MTATQQSAAEALAERVFGSAIAASDLACIYLGLKLGLYEQLATGPHTPETLATATGTEARYTREWLQQQAAAGLIGYAEPDSFALIPGTEANFLDPDSLLSVQGLPRLVMGELRTLPDLVEAFRTGKGIAFGDYGSDVREGVALLNRPSFTAELPGWLAAIPEVDDRLRRPGARVADIGCGHGFSTLAIAAAYPAAHVDGFDEDAASIEHARADAGAAPRVRFFRQDASDGTLAGSYDLVTMLEVVHDLAEPVAVLRAARDLLNPGGSVLVVDERVPERFTAPSEDPLERLCYGTSVLHCLPAGRTCDHSAATGTVMRPHTLLDYAAQAGFAGAEVLDIEHVRWRLFRLTP